MTKRKPLATNGMFAGELFHERNYYKRKVLTAADHPSLIDFWTLKFREYGKVNLSNQKIRINSRYLKQLESEEETNFYAANFVADAFADLKKYCHSAAFGVNKIISQRSLYASISPQRQNMWTPVEKEYEAHIRVIFESFLKTFMQLQSYNKRARNIDTFLELFLEFSKDQNKELMDLKNPPISLI